MSPSLSPINPINAITTRLRYHWRGVLIALAGVIIVALAATFILRTTLPLTLQAEQRASQSINLPVVIKLGQAVKDVPLEKISMQPATSGTWSHKSSGFLGDSKLVFTPKDTLRAGTTYTVTVLAISRMLLGDSRAYKVEFATERAPGLQKAGLGALTDSATIAADAALSFTFTSPTTHLRKLTLSTLPEAELQLSSEKDQVYTWKPKTLLPQGQALTVILTDTQNNEVLVKKTLQVATEPTLKTPVKPDHFTPDDTALVGFSEPIDPASSKYIEFEIAGEGNWRDDITYSFKPTKIEPGKTYSYTLKQGFRSKAGGVLATAITNTFATTGPVIVIGSSPRGANLAQAKQVVSFSFDQLVDKASAASRLAVSSGNVSGITWQGNTMAATITDIGFQRSFTATVQAGVGNAGFGLPSNRSYQVSFTTEARSIKLPIAAIRQQHAGTCSAASLKMALAYRGVQADEMSIVNAMGYAPRDIDKSTDPPTWDDSSQMFVGSVDGSIIKGTGAGPDAPPVAKAARAFGRNASATTGASVSWVAQQLYAGNPVLVFGAFRDTGYTSWQTPGGKKVIMNLTGHVRIAIGVIGEPDDPLGFWVNDPLSSSTTYWAAGSLSANMGLDPDRQAVVIY